MEDIPRSFLKQNIIQNLFLLGLLPALTCHFFFLTFSTFSFFYFMKLLLNIDKNSVALINWQYKFAVKFTILMEYPKDKQSLKRSKRELDKLLLVSNWLQRSFCL